MWLAFTAQSPCLVRCPFFLREATAATPHSDFLICAGKQDSSQHEQLYNAKVRFLEVLRKAQNRAQQVLNMGIAPESKSANLLGPPAQARNLQCRMN